MVEGAPGAAAEAADSALTEDLALVFDFLGVADPGRPSPDMEPEARRRRLFEALEKVVRAQREPQVLLFEDLHWLDDASEALLERLAESVTGSCTLLLVNYRPEYRSRWTESSNFSRLSLASLGGGAIDELLTELLGSDPSVESLVQLVRAGTGGNPFFIEEVVHELAESGALRRDANRSPQRSDRGARTGARDGRANAHIRRNAGGHARPTVPSVPGQWQSRSCARCGRGGSWCSAEVDGAALEATADLSYALVLMRARGLDDAVAVDCALTRGMALIEETRARCFEPFVRLQRAEFERLRGNVVGSDRELREAHQLFSHMGIRAPELQR